MKLIDAVSILNEVDGKSIEYMEYWGLSTIREAIRTVKSRKRVPDDIKGLAEGISYKIYIQSITPKHWRSS